MPVPQIYPGTTILVDPLAYQLGVAAWQTECVRVAAENGYALLPFHDQFIITPNESQKEKAQMAP
jgi:hypothetical protein